MYVYDQPQQMVINDGYYYWQCVRHDKDIYTTLWKLVYGFIRVHNSIMCTLKIKYYQVHSVCGFDKIQLLRTPKRVNSKN